MTEILNLDQEYQFKIDLKSGLEKPRKQIPSKYLYDERGCELFNQITRHPDYYLTQCELEILSNCKNKLAQLMVGAPFNLIELGPGEGIKTQMLIEEFSRHALSFSYMPIDISDKYLKILIQQLKRNLPELDALAIHSDYFKGLKDLSAQSDRRNLVLFLGSSIGNLDPIATKDFLHQLHHSLNKNDYVFLGFDLYKDTEILLRAYNDDEGLTREFNLNLLRRINSECAADFNVEKFRHYAAYNVYSRAMESYLISLEAQVVNIDALAQYFYFSEMEPIHVEFSYKYHLAQIEELSRTAGFKMIETFTDSKSYFIDTLWEVE